MTEPTNRPLLILVAGPYRSYTNDDFTKIAANYRRMNQAALDLFRRGHTPVTGEAIALPLIEFAASEQMGDVPWNEIFHPIGRRLIAHVLPFSASKAARWAPMRWLSSRAAGKPVFFGWPRCPSSCRRVGVSARVAR